VSQNFLGSVNYSPLLESSACHSTEQSSMCGSEMANSPVYCCASCSQTLSSVTPMKGSEAALTRSH